MRRTFCAFAIAGLISAQVASAGPDQDFAVGLSFDTPGAMVEGRYRLSDNVTVRVPFGYEVEAGQSLLGATSYQSEVTAGGLGLVADYAPMGGGFRISGGAVIPHNATRGAAQGDVGVAGALYNGADLVLDIRPDTWLNPMVALGYSREFDSGLSIRGNLGAFFQSSTAASLTDRNGVVPGAALRAEAASLQSDLAVVPYLNLGLNLRF